MRKGVVGEISRALVAFVTCLVVSSLAHRAWGSEPPTAGFPAEPAATAAPASTPQPAPSPSLPPTARSAPARTVVYVPAAAAPPATTTPPPAAPRDVTLSFSPLHLLLPVLEVHAELRVGRFLGVTAFGGLGRVTVEVPDAYDPRQTDDEALTLYEAGAIVSFYPLEPFENLTLGAELDWVRLSSDDLGDESVRGLATGLAVGPILGYKHVAASGFTVVVQGGVARIAIHAEASDDQDTERDDDQQWVPILNLHLGWSL